MKSIILNNNNLVPSVYKNQYKYNFRNNVSFKKNTKIGLHSLIIPYSWQNINKSQFNNNSLKIIYIL